MPYSGLHAMAVAFKSPGFLDFNAFEQELQIHCLFF